MKTLIICGNPCIQNIYHQTQSGHESQEVHRAESFKQCLGGKGLNVSGYLNHHQVEHHVFLPSSQLAIGLQVKDKMTQLEYSHPIYTALIRDLRVCTTLISEGAIQEWVGPSPQMTALENKELLSNLKSLIDRIEFDRIVVSGTILGTKIEKLFDILVKYKQSGGVLVVDSFQNFSYWSEARVFPDIWKLNSDEWSVVGEYSPEYNHVKIETNSHEVRLDIGMIDGEIQGHKSPVQTIEKPINTIGAGDIWLGEFLLQTSGVKDLSHQNWSHILSQANQAAFKRVQRLNLWDF